jgi:hypothetical protein
MDIQSPKSVGGVASAGEGMTVGAASIRRATSRRWSGRSCAKGRGVTGLTDRLRVAGPLGGRSTVSVRFSDIGER